MLLEIHSLYFLAVLIFMIRSNRGTVLSGVDDCFTEESSVICRHSLPYNLPDNMSRVIVKEFLLARINNETFSHKNWVSIDFLDITVNLNVRLHLSDFNFFSLTNLKTLGIHSPELTFNDEQSRRNILYGLTSLQSLNLSSCYNLNTADVLAMLETHKRLDTLMLDQLATDGARNLVLDNSFFKIIYKLKIRKLSLSGCDLLFKGPFDLENITYNLNDLDISNTTLIYADGKSRNKISVLMKTVLSNLRKFDASLIPSRFFEFDYGYFSNNIINPKCNQSINDNIGSLIYKAENLKLNRMLSKSMEINNSSIDLSKCNISIKSLQLRSNNIHFFNATILWPSKMQLYDLDLSLNGLEYLSPFAFGSISSLKVFHLAHNKLYHMSSFREFKYMFFTFKYLFHLDLSNNRLSWLPFDVFSKNINLTVLDLSHNELASVSFKIRHLINLRFLNMENNKILYIDGADFSNLVFLIQSVPEPVDISFTHNPLLCSCKAEGFVTWLSLYVKTNKIEKYVCTFEGTTILLDENAVEEARFSCIRSRIVTVSISAGVATLCIASLIITCVAYRKRQRLKARKRANFLEDFKNRLLRQQFLCFLSFSSEDEGHEIRNIYENLRETLKALTGIEQEVVCFGDRRFNLGFSIVDEILRCISESCVGIFVASNNFCESHWCQMELREAYELNKPIILICKEDIDLTIMPPLMLKVFRQFTRAKLVTNENGEIEIIPDYELLCNSILKHAARRYEEEMK